MAYSQIKKLRSAAGRDADGDKGFTLVELMVVVLVIAILLAIAIPTFLGARERSQDRAAQSNLRNALTAAKVAFSNDGDYANAQSTDLSDIEPRLTYLGASATSPAENSISVYVDAGTCSSTYTQDQTQASCVVGTWSSGSCTTHSHRTTQAHCTTAYTWTGGTNAVWAGAVWSESETCWMLQDRSEVNPLGTSYGHHTTASSCTGSFASTTTNVPNSDW